mgnify:FL=1
MGRHKTTSRDQDADRGERPEIDGAGEHAEHEPDAAAAAEETDRADELERQLAELDARYRRALADYQNFQRRSVENERRAREAGAVSVVESLIPVLDHFRLALDQDPSKMSAEGLMGGVRAILAEFERVLGSCGVAPIAPEAGEPFDPMRHEAMMRADSDAVDPGCVVQLLQQGYALGQRVVRPAKVSVRPEEDGPAASENASDDRADEDGGETPPDPDSNTQQNRGE